MDNKFDELAKGLAESVTRRQTLKKFSVGLAGMALACFGLPRPAAAAQRTGNCVVEWTPISGSKKSAFYTGHCLNPSTCQSGLSKDCGNGSVNGFTASSSCAGWFIGSHSCSF